MVHIGKVSLHTLGVPAELTGRCGGTFTFSGSVLLDYTLPGDSRDFIRLATIQPDGSCFRPFFAGDVPRKRTANGIRFMFFPDCKRILLGDYVMECAPDIDHCETAALLPVRYPPMEAGDHAYVRHWSEIIVSPDNEHMAWTALAGVGGSANYVARLARRGDCYELGNVQRVSSLSPWTEDSEHPGYMKPSCIRGGEIKQFVRGGKAISMAGMGNDSRLADSVVQNLTTGEVTQITHTPGYDETTIFSPDERLGLVMSTRFSPATNCAILTLLPRPFMRLALSDILMPVYLYSIAGVRRRGGGNIGPALIDVSRSMNEPDYLGVDLSDPSGEWQYCSPMSWHPNNRLGMWNEVSRDGRRRVRMVYLPEYTPGCAVPPAPVPEPAAFAVSVDKVCPQAIVHPPLCRVKGKAEGEFSLVKENGQTLCRYERYSEDGRTQYHGAECVRRERERFVYEADLSCSGVHTGQMKLRLSFRCRYDSHEAWLELAPDENGKPRSFGFSRYDGKTLTVETMSQTSGIDE